MQRRQVGIVMLAEGRSGSSWLGKLTNDIGTMGVSSEWVDPKLLGVGHKVTDARTYLDAVISAASSENGRFALKVFPRHVLWFAEHFGADFLSLCGSSYETTFVRLTRNDRLRQAISLVRAKQSGRWSSDAKADGRAIVFDRGEIARAIHFLERSEAFWNAYQLIGGMDVVRFAYEELVNDPSPFLDWSAKTLDVTYDRCPATTYAIQRDSETEIWVKKFTDPSSEAGLAALTLGRVPDLNLKVLGRMMRRRQSPWWELYAF